ncbi:MAG: hypothetical protein H6587_08885 [Flavobacteriales bacterium]|nr:hypothetical protein [Flavobacteriales bacterium]MCB9364670.1 hypothetical protein [Flavobacteriales bacterium]
MKQDGNIEDWYRDELSNFEVNPEINGWESISNQLDSAAPLTDENVESWYVKELEKFQSIPDKAVWNKLSTKLDVTSVWDKLLVSLNRYDRIIWWRNTAFKSAALLLFLLGGYYTYTNLDSDKNNDSTIVNYSVTKNKLSDPNEKVENDLLNVKNTLTETELSQSESVQENQEGALTSNSALLQLTNVVKREESAKRNISTSSSEIALASTGKYIHKINPLKAGVLGADYVISPLIRNNTSGINLETKTLEAKEFLVKKDQNKIIFNAKRFSSHFVFGMYARRLYFGINTGAKYQTLFASSKQNEALSNFTKKQLMDFGGSFGATLGLIVSDKFNIETNVNLLSSSGCKHEYVVGENSFIEEINLEYSTVSILAKKMNNKSTFDNKKYSTNYIGGMYVGFLAAAEVDVDGDARTIKDQFTSTDIGIVLGIEQDRYITKELVITPGVRFNQSLLNTSKPSNEMMSASRNFSVEFNVGLKYIFLKKN